MARLSLDDSDKQVRDWFIKYAKSLGCKTFFDQMGNLFAIRPGRNNSAPPVMMGSHLDTQPTGGRYDGILGVVSGLEVIRVLQENNYETEGPVGVVNWTKYLCPHSTCDTLLTHFQRGGSKIPQNGRLIRCMGRRHPPPNSMGSQRSLSHRRKPKVHERRTRQNRLLW